MQINRDVTERDCNFVFKDHSSQRHHYVHCRQLVFEMLRLLMLLQCHRQLDSPIQKPSMGTGFVQAQSGQDTANIQQVTKLKTKERAPVGHFTWNSLLNIIIMCTVDGQIRFPVLSYIQSQRMLGSSDHHQPTQASITRVPNSGRRSGNVEYFGHINFFRNVGRPRKKTSAPLFFLHLT